MENAAGVRVCEMGKTEAAGEGLGLDPSLRGLPGLLPSSGLRFPARAISEKLIFNDTSKP